MDQLDLFAPTPMASVCVQPNEHGIYPNDGAEVFTLPVDRKGWQGLPLAQIELLHAEGGWLAASQVSTPSGGYGHALCGRFGGGFHETRTHALRSARRRMLAYCIGASESRKISQWLETVR